MYLDLDGFKTINDTHGHNCGDEILKMVAERLVGSSRKEDTVARVGGDEFVIVLDSVSGIKDACGPASKLVDRLSEPYQIADLTLNLSTSIGIAIYPDDADTVEALINAADGALYQAKRAGKGRYCCASPAS
jgi:diguanylate cyclase (GGDEF)-like protein